MDLGVLIMEAGELGRLLERLEPPTLADLALAGTIIQGLGVLPEVMVALEGQEAVFLLMVGTLEAGLGILEELEKKVLLPPMLDMLAAQEQVVILF